MKTIEKEKKEKPHVRLTKEENNLYLKLFESYCSSHPFHKDKVITYFSKTILIQKIVTSDKVKELFQKSRLSNSVLMEIWTIAAHPDKQHLEKKSFVLALKLIAIYQNFQTLDQYEELVGSGKIKLACFDNDKEELQNQFIEPYEEKQAQDLGQINLQSQLGDDDLQVSITETKQITQGYFGMSSYTQYKLETRSKLPSYKENYIYQVFRRFSDFEWLLQKFQENESYKGLIIPPLPEKQYLGNLDIKFVEKRRDELENFLKVIATHKILKLDPQLMHFLTNENFENYKGNPSAFQKVIGMYEQLPSVKNLSINSIQDVISTSIAHVRNEHINEPEELKTQIDFNNKQLETENNLIILNETLNSLKKQKELNNENAKSVLIIGQILQKISNFDTIGSPSQDQTNIPPNFISDCHALDSDEDSPTIHKESSTGDFDHLDIQSDCKIAKVFADYYNLMTQNSTIQCEIYLKEKVTKLQGIILAFNERRSYIKNYVNKVEIRASKNEKLNQLGADTASLIELNNEIEALNNEISNMKKAIINYNTNITKELEQIENARNNQMKKLIFTYSNNSLNYQQRVEQFIRDKMENFLISK